MKIKKTLTVKGIKIDLIFDEDLHCVNIISDHIGYIDGSVRESINGNVGGYINGTLGGRILGVIFDK